MKFCLLGFYCSKGKSVKDEERKMKSLEMHAERNNSAAFLLLLLIRVNFWMVSIETVAKLNNTFNSWFRFFPHTKSQPPSSPSNRCTVDQMDCSALIGTGKQHFFRRFRKIANSDNHLRHACLSVCPHRTAWLSRYGFSWNLVFECF